MAPDDLASGGDEPPRMSCLRRSLRLMVVVAGAALTTWCLWRAVTGRVWEDPQRLQMGLYVFWMYPLAAWWAWIRLGESAPLRAREVLVDLLTLALAGSRTIAPVYPGSGHVLFLLYSLPTVAHRPYRVVAAVALAVTMAVKLLAWGDVLSPAISAGVVVVLLWVRGTLKTLLRRRRGLPAGGRPG